MSAVKQFKKLINTGKPAEFESIISKINDYDIISFDIFDTLLKRCVHNPTDVFLYMEKKLGLEGFAEKRIAAEKKAREKKQGFEISIEDIYNELDENLMDEEMKAESELLMANPDIYPIFRWCIQRKRVVLISDMYLPERFIVDVLDREGIKGYTKLYLSSTINKKKRDGNIYKLVLDDIGNANKLIHIGDSIKEDCIIPRKLGIDTIHIPRYTPKSRYHIVEKSVDETVINSFLDNTSQLNTDDYYRFGYEKFGMFLWGFVRWLHNNLEKEKIHRVFFLSRDGLIMKKAFDILYDDVETNYLEVSRRSLRVPILWMNPEYEYVMEMLPPSKQVTLTNIFDGIGLDINNYADVVEKNGFSLDSVFERKDLRANNDLNKLYNQLEKDIICNSKMEFELLAKYLKQNCMEGRFAIVDIGWAGSMQRYLQEVLTSLNIFCDIKGYYIGVVEDYIRNKSVLSNMDLNGYLFDFSHNMHSIDTRRPFLGLFETLFLEQDGSVKNYMELDGKIMAKRIPYEYIENHKPTYEYECVAKIQEGALDFVSRFGRKNVDISPAILFSGIEKTGIYPSMKEVSLFGDFRFFDEGETTYLAKPQGMFHYITKRHELKKDFLSSRWKIGFMKKMFRLKLPYEKMYKLLLKYK